MSSKVTLDSLMIEIKKLRCKITYLCMTSDFYDNITIYQTLLIFSIR